MKKFLLFILTISLMFGVVACGEVTTSVQTTQTTTQVTTGQTTETTTLQSFTVTFNTNGGTAVESQTVTMNGVVTEPEDPTKEGYQFEYWYLDSSDTPYDFSTQVTGNIELTAYWTEDIDPNLALIQVDIDALSDNLIINRYELDLPVRGTVNRSYIKWSSDSPYISSSGIVLPTPESETATVGQITGTFILNGTVVTHSFDIPLSHADPVVITNEVVVPFENLTTEYDVSDTTLTLYFEDGGTVPYVKVEDFLGILDGFIDPSVNIDIVKDGDTLQLSYQYYDSDYDETYDLVVTIDALENTITTNDPGFYWAYVYSTETNYGRHIEYDINNPGSYSTDGNDIVFDLDDYNMDIAKYNGDIVLPYYLVNQLFAGSSYYNVYYNYDGLYGIYALPSSGSFEYRTIKSSSMNNQDIPADLLVSTFNMLAFDMDYFYGLKEVMSIDTYYTYLYDQKDDLLQRDPEEFEYALRDFLLKTIDEPHTSYGYPSYFNKVSWAGPELNNLKYYGSRFTQWYYNGLFAVDDVIGEKWGESTDNSWNANSGKRPHYWFLDDVTAMLTLDDFYTADIDESSSYDASIAADILKVDDSSLILPAINGGTKYFFYNESDDNDIKMEILVKGLTVDYLTTYATELTNLGYTYINQTTTDEDKLNGYYQITITDGENETSYMVQISYSEDLNLFYLGIIDRIPADFDSSWPFTVDVFDTVNSDSAVYMEMMMDQIMAEKPELENIILDLSWNTGGNVGALYRIVGFITDQPFAVSGVDRGTGSESTYYVIIDGVPTYTQLNWGLLITPVTFSAANEMATIFLENDLGPIIGVKSGGGACSITPILLPNGTAFTMSSNNMNAYRTGTGTEDDPYVYHNNEFGINPDYPIDIEDIYNPDVLLQIFETD